MRIVVCCYCKHYFELIHWKNSDAKLTSHAAESEKQKLISTLREEKDF